MIEIGHKNYLIDIDGCICDHVDNEEPEKMATVEPYEDAIKMINKWYDEGHYICFFTARTLEHKKVTDDWLDRSGVKYHKVIYGKPRGGNYHYIDDRPIRATQFRGKFGDFVEIEKKILVFEE